MDWLQVVLLGVIQGLTEFIPVSSSGHLVLFPSLLGEDSTPLLFGVAVHVGTLFSAVLYYWTDVGRALRGTGRMLRGLATGKVRVVVREDPEARLAFLILVGTVPTVLLAMALRGLEDHLFAMPVLAAGCLLVTGAMLLLTDRFERRHPPGVGTTEREGRVAQALIVGVAQGIAILPGISRSGACLIAGILGGFEREFAVRYAFLLMIPAVAGAALLEATKVTAETVGTGILVQCAAGAAIAGLVGLGAIWIVVKTVQRRYLWVFGLYCLAVGMASLGLLAGGSG